MTSPLDGYLVHLNANGDRFAEVIRSGPPGAPVTACPGWTLRDLAHHLGYVHRWARLAVTSAAPPDEAQIESPPSGGPENLADWMSAGVGELVAALAELDPDAPTWHPFPAAQVAAVWPRRQAQETAVHRWDAEAAVHALTPIDPWLAADGVAEYFELIVPRRVQRDGITPPVGTLGLHLEDVDRLVTVTAGGGKGVGVAISAASESPTGSTDDLVVGRAEAVLLALWGRRPLPVPPDSELARHWFAVGGN